MKKIEKNKYNNKIKIGVVLFVIAFIFFLFCPSIKLLTIFNIISILLCIVSIIFCILSKKEIKVTEEKGKKLGNLLLTFNLILIILSLLSLVGSLMISNTNLNESICVRSDMVKNCKDKKNGVYTCKYMDQVEIKCKEEFLEESQYK